MSKKMVNEGVTSTSIKYLICLTISGVLVKKEVSKKRKKQKIRLTGNAYSIFLFIDLIFDI